MKTRVIWNRAPADGGVIKYGPDDRVAAFGACAPRWSHRRAYTLADAEAIAEWLREREAGYPPHEALMPTQEWVP